MHSFVYLLLSCDEENKKSGAIIVLPIIRVFVSVKHIDNHLCIVYDITYR